MAETIYTSAVNRLACTLHLPEEAVWFFVRRLCRDYQLERVDDVTRMTDLSEQYGLDFDLRPQNAWMRAILLDGAMRSPSRRVNCLCGEVQHREQVDAYNKALDEKLVRKRS